jgi:TatD DNase family protein
VTEPLFDTHCHLMLPEFEADLADTLARARAAGVGSLLLPGIDLATSRAAVRLSEGHPGLYAAVGIHPHLAESWSEPAAAELRELARSPAVRAIGEIGLDYHRGRATQASQEAALRGQLALAKQLGLPIVVHHRDSIGELLPTLIEWSSDLDSEHRTRAGVLHAFSGGPEHARAAVDAGFFIGVAGPVTYPNAHPLRDLVRGLDRERLLLETDSPYLPPQSQRGRRNEPAHLSEIAAALAELQGSPLALVARSTSRNARTLFGLSNGSRDPDLR